MKSRPQAALYVGEFGPPSGAAKANPDQLPMRAVPERPSFRTH